MLVLKTLSGYAVSREDKLRAQGLDPAQFQDNSSSSSLEEARLVLDLTQSQTATPTTTPTTATPPAPATSTRGQVTMGDKPQSAAGSRGGRVAGGEEVGGGERDEGVSSTPLPPALGVPIVTHSKGSREGMPTCVGTTLPPLCIAHKWLKLS